MDDAIGNQIMQFRDYHNQHPIMRSLTLFQKQKDASLQSPIIDNRPYFWNVHVALTKEVDNMHFILNRLL